jgi:hypothetical protein
MDPRAIEELSRRQHGAFSRAQALDLGATPRMIALRVRDRSWLRMTSGVYAHPAVRPTWERQVMAASLVHAGPSAAARGTAAALHGVEGFRRGRPVLVRPVGSAVANPLARVHRTRHFDVRDLCRVSGILVTTPARTAIDLAPMLTGRDLGRLVDYSVLAARLDLDVLVDRAAVLLASGVPGRRAMLAVLADRLSDYVPPASELEALMFEVLARAGHPAPIRQLHVPWRPGRAGTVDAAYPAARVLLEADGRAWHTRVDAFENDHQRDLEATAHGWTTVRVTWLQLHAGAELFLAAVGHLLAK